MIKTNKIFLLLCITSFFTINCDESLFSRLKTTVSRFATRAYIKMNSGQFSEKTLDKAVEKGDLYFLQTLKSYKERQYSELSLNKASLEKAVSHGNNRLSEWLLENDYADAHYQTNALEVALDKKDFYLIGLLLINRPELFRVLNKIKANFTPEEQEAILKHASQIKNLSHQIQRHNKSEDYVELSKLNSTWAKKVFSALKSYSGKNSAFWKLVQLNPLLKEDFSNLKYIQKNGAENIEDIKEFIQPSEYEHYLRDLIEAFVNCKDVERKLNLKLLIEEVAKKFDSLSLIKQKIDMLLKNFKFDEAKELFSLNLEDSIDLSNFNRVYSDFCQKKDLFLKRKRFVHVHSKNKGRKFSNFYLETAQELNKGNSDILKNRLLLDFTINELNRLSRKYDFYASQLEQCCVCLDDYSNVNSAFILCKNHHAVCVKCFSNPQLQVCPQCRGDLIIDKLSTCIGCGKPSERLKFTYCFTCEASHLICSECNTLPCCSLSRPELIVPSKVEEIFTKYRSLLEENFGQEIFSLELVFSRRLKDQDDLLKKLQDQLYNLKKEADNLKNDLENIGYSPQLNVIGQIQLVCTINVLDNLHAKKIREYNKIADLFNAALKERKKIQQESIEKKEFLSKCFFDNISKLKNILNNTLIEQVGSVFASSFSL